MRLNTAPATTVLTRTPRRPGQQTGPSSFRVVLRRDRGLALDGNAGRDGHATRAGGLNRVDVFDVVVDAGRRVRFEFFVRELPREFPLERVQEVRRVAHLGVSVIALIEQFEAVGHADRESLQQLGARATLVADDRDIKLVFRHARESTKALASAHLASRVRLVSSIRPLVRRPALVSSVLAPIFFIGGTLVAEVLWPEFDPVRQTISELAAGDAPTRIFMTIMFALTGVCHLVTAIYAVGVGRLGRIALGLAGVATLGVAAFPLPTVATTSDEHRLAAIIGFVLLAIWPALGMRFGPGFPWLIRPVGALLGTALMAAVCFWFLAVWSSPETGYVGVVERAAANLESLWPALVVAALYLRQRRDTALGASSRSPE